MDAIDLTLQETLLGFIERYEPPPNTKQRILWEARLEQDRLEARPAEQDIATRLRMPREYGQVHFAWNMLYSQCYSHVFLL